MKKKFYNTITVEVIKSILERKKSNPFSRGFCKNDRGLLNERTWWLFTSILNKMFVILKNYRQYKSRLYLCAGVELPFVLLVGIPDLY